MDIRVEITEKKLRELVLEYLQNKLGDVSIGADDIDIQVKSKQNYRSEWESAAFRAILDKHGV